MARSAKPRTRTVSSSEAKQQWDAMIAAASDGEDVVVEVSGEAKTVMISVEAFEELRRAREDARRNEALEWLRVFEARQMERNKDLTQEEADALADRAAHEIFDELAAEGKLGFTRDERRS